MKSADKIMSFDKLYKKAEAKYFKYSLKTNSILLTLLLVAGLLALGFANGSLTYLKEKMSDPFVNWLDLVIPMNKNLEIEDNIPTKLSQDKELMESYDIKDINRDLNN